MQQTFAFSRQAALFDLDGTLVRTFIDFGRMREEMHNLSQKFGTKSATEGETDILEIVQKMAQTLGGEAGNAARGEAYAVLEAIEAEGCAAPERIEGASALLSTLRAQGVPVGIITRNCRPVAEDLLRRADLPHDVLVAREDTREFKPHPEPVLFACRALGVSPGRTTMTGDLWADIAAGKAAGVGGTIGIAWPYAGPDRFALCPPDFEVASLVEAAALLVAG